MDFKKLRNELLTIDSEFAKSYFEKDLSFEISQKIFEARVEKGLTQKQLAHLVGTKQSGIARLERGTTLPSLTLLEKIAKVIGKPLLVKFGDEHTTINKHYYSINQEDITLVSIESAIVQTNSINQVTFIK